MAAAMVTAMSAEWKRVELLCEIMRKSRQTGEQQLEQLQALSALQDEVLACRTNGVWLFLNASGLEQLHFDILALIVAPEISHVVSYFYSDHDKDHATTGLSQRLLQALLSLRPEDHHELSTVLHPQSPLLQQGLIHVERRSSGLTVQASRKLRSLILGMDTHDAPPGASLVARKADWQDLIAPVAVELALKQFLSLLRNRPIVEDQWGGAKRGGPVALFSGPSGTGKTLAASVVATQLAMPLYRVDLGQLVSKYIGETEKNLNSLFDSVSGTDTILLFDESDALFGKRGEVKDARDRYANLEVSHLLQRIENHFSPCILTTNLRSSIDPAFLRRFHIVVDFDLPETEDRLKLWRRHLPPRAPLATSLDLLLVAQTVRLSGAAIENAALHASYLAADSRGVIAMPDIVAGIWHELSKDGGRCCLNDLGALADYLVETDDVQDRPSYTQAAA